MDGSYRDPRTESDISDERISGEVLTGLRGIQKGIEDFDRSACGYPLVELTALFAVLPGSSPIDSTHLTLSYLLSRVHRHVRQYT